ncbi:MAG: hypothetical protein K1X85_01380 [Ignavibacteria bacterium]|nr:hypothetical protein [Ignavibacteria bacterium]
MKNRTLSISLLINFLMLCYQISFAQKINTSNESLPVTLEQKSEDIFSSNKRSYSDREMTIMNEMTHLKEDYKTGNNEKISALQKQLEGHSESQTKNSELSLISANANSFKSIPLQSEQLTLKEIYASNSAYIKAVATQVEQRNPGAGTIWVVLAVGAGDVGVGASPDTLLYFNSTNNGVSYSLIKRVAFNTGIKINYDEMDLEIVEPFTNDKYLHLVLSVITDGFTGAHLAGIVSFKKSDQSVGGGPSFNFPGFDSNVSKYSKPRITSDNAKYPAEAYLTITVTQDSTDGVNNFIMTKICKVYNPYALISGSSQITFLPQSIHAPVIGYSSEAQTDVAYYNSGGTVDGDSIVFVQSGFPGTDQYVGIYKNYGNTLVYPSYSGSLSGNSYHKEFARVAANGGADQKSIFITYVEREDYMSNYYYSLNTFKTSNGINWTKMQLAGGGDANSVIRNPDIIGRRGVDGKFYITNKWVTPQKDIISSFVIQNLNVKSFTADHNDQVTGSYASPKPSFRFINNDSCLTVWPTYSSLYSSCGCRAVNLTVGFIIEGLYNPATDSAGVDISTVHLRNSFPPYSIVSSAFCNNLSFVTFPAAAPGNYYISVNHRNSVETWYYQPVNLNDSVLFGLNFYSGQGKAYGSNLKQIDTSPLLFAIYSGDVNQDGTIDATDISAIDNDVQNFVGGYVVTDLTGDDFVDGTDFVIADNNAANFVSVIRP